MLKEKNYPCPICKGNKELPVEYYGFYAAWDEETPYVKCRTCGGLGYILAWQQENA